MSAVRVWREKVAKAVPFQVLPTSRWSEQVPTYRDANPAVIRSALTRAQARPGGNWYVIAASSAITTAAVGVTVAGQELVAWRDGDGALLVAPRACPHLGADLSQAPVDCGTLVCPWHGLRLGRRRHGTWKPYPSHDDGVLCWVRLDLPGDRVRTGAPVAMVRPGEPAVAAVARLDGVCEPADIVANRLDPWHGAWFHPYSFTRLKVLSAPPADDDLPEELDRFVVDVTFRIGRLGVPVIAEFTTPAPRTVVMRIVEGEGQGSVVETHATPMGQDRDGRCRTSVVEAVIAHSDRRHFGAGLRVAPLIRPLMRRAATRLWRDDLAYAERLYELRS
ncbi:Rieske (2Fe-2S) protein [Mycolicibacterium pyrenivorans]|uniref:Rieske (2Fe-2S) protein n=1 Tax=Mycolicibacterium pyrenivorans TaxID=187102 RepID=UPI0021F3BE27|nr:Rieske (2Fe-2S) protein [Mycolicibacterium pyrenivorans]MCV7151644.1 Rieske (2Fe-2S) protein [Mycolicibacterium pyrenivorans]